MGVHPNGQDDKLQFKLDAAQEKAAALGVLLMHINSVFNTSWVASYVNNFIDKGRVKKVVVQGDAQFRMLPEDVAYWQARNSKGEMVSFSVAVGFTVCRAWNAIAVFLRSILSAKVHRA